MSRIGTIARRTFLVGSVAVVGGAAFGVYAARKPHPNPLQTGEGEAAITPYVRIDGDGVTLITPRADSGQGVYHVQAALIAEELDVDLDAIAIDPGPPAPAYWNTALGAEAAEFMVPAQGAMHNATEGVVTAAMKPMGMQITGGSTSVPDGFDKLRAAGASARETLKSAAAARSGVDVTLLETESGHVILPDGSRIAYKDLAPELAETPVVQDVPLRAPEDWRYIGKPMQRLDIVAKSTGTQTYGIDVEVEGMVHATVLQSRPRRRSGGLGRAEALTMRGVTDIVPITGGLGIVADNTWRAFKAARAISAEWGAPDFPAEQEGHWAALEAAFTEEARDSRKRDDGDVEAALAEGEVIEAEYRAPYLAHAPLEPLSAIVRVNADSAEVWTGTQIPRFLQNNVARIAGIDAENVIVHAQMMGAPSATGSKTRW